MKKQIPSILRDAPNYWNPKMNDFQIKNNYPFGVIVTSKNSKTLLSEVPIEEILDLMTNNLLILFRGFDSLNSLEFVEYAENYGKLLEWNFGKILELKVQENAQNYLFTPGKVPLHWDGAFAEIVPSFQLFQCLEAPNCESGGETIFINTVSLLEDQLKDHPNWEDLKIYYRTDKLAHYGGEIEQNLIASHPKTAKKIIRFAEPTEQEFQKLNPLHVSVPGMDEEQQALLLKQLTETLYQDKYSYTHKWEDGDFLLADNHALLHGRTPFTAESRRHIQRIHII